MDFFTKSTGNAKYFSIQPSFLGGLLFWYAEETMLVYWCWGGYNGEQIWPELFWAASFVHGVHFITPKWLNARDVWMITGYAKSESAWQVFQRVLPKGMNTRYELLTGHLRGSGTETICWAQSQLAPTLWRVWMCSPSQRLQPLQRRVNRPVPLCWDNSPPAAYIDSQNASHFVDLPAHTKKTKHGHENPCSADAGHGLFIF